MKKLSNIVLVIAFFAGLSLLLYPSVSDYWNSFHQSRAIASYVEEVSTLDEEAYQAMLDSAAEYNQKITAGTGPHSLSDEELEAYHQNLDASGSGIMGYIEIPTIDVKLPIYHGTDEGVLQVAVGHLPWSSLPVGGPGTHTVLSGHRGLPSATLFTDLDQLRTGDTFLIQVLDEVLTYEVDQILIVDPDDTEALRVEAEKDYCTLVTCTPYGVNTHRLLVRGHRIETEQEAVAIRVMADAIQLEALITAPILAAPILLLLLVVVFTRGKNRVTRINLGEKENESHETQA